LSLASTGTFASLTSTLDDARVAALRSLWCWVGGGERCEGLAERTGMRLLRVVCGGGFRRVRRRCVRTM
jgi:hypothetical protein